MKRHLKWTIKNQKIEEKEKQGESKEYIWG